MTIVVTLGTDFRALQNIAAEPGISEILSYYDKYDFIISDKDGDEELTSRADLNFFGNGARADEKKTRNGLCVLSVSAGAEMPKMTEPL